MATRTSHIHIFPKTKTRKEYKLEMYKDLDSRIVYHFRLRNNLFTSIKKSADSLGMDTTSFFRFILKCSVEENIKNSYPMIEDYKYIKIPLTKQLLDEYEICQTYIRNIAGVWEREAENSTHTGTQKIVNSDMNNFILRLVDFMEVDEFNLKKIQYQQRFCEVLFTSQSTSSKDNITSNIVEVHQKDLECEAENYLKMHLAQDLEEAINDLYYKKNRYLKIYLTRDSERAINYLYSKFNRQYTKELLAYTIIMVEIKALKRLVSKIPPKLDREDASFDSDEFEFVRFKEKITERYGQSTSSKTYSSIALSVPKDLAERINYAWDEYTFENETNEEPADYICLLLKKAMEEKGAFVKSHKSKIPDKEECFKFNEESIVKVAKLDNENDDGTKDYIIEEIKDKYNLGIENEIKKLCKYYELQKEDELIEYALKSLYEIITPENKRITNINDIKASLRKEFEGYDEQEENVIYDIFVFAIYCLSNASQK